MTRWDAFQQLSSHPWYERLFKKLSARDVDWAQRFLSETHHLPLPEFETRLNRVFLHDPNKPKAYITLWELLQVAALNSHHANKS